MIYLQTHVVIAVYEYKGGEVTEGFFIDLPNKKQDPKQYAKDYIKGVLSSRQFGQKFKYITDIKSISKTKISPICENLKNLLKENYLKSPR